MLSIVKFVVFLRIIASKSVMPHHEHDRKTFKFQMNVENSANTVQTSIIDKHLQKKSKLFVVSVWVVGEGEYLAVW